MKDCGSKDCYSCRKQYCVNSCYNFNCSSRIEISDVSGNGCTEAFRCIGFISRKTYLERKGEVQNG